LFFAPLALGYIMYTFNELALDKINGHVYQGGSREEDNCTFNFAEYED